MVDLGQASLRGRAPRHDSTRIRVAPAPPAFAAFGDLYLVIQGGTERLSAAFADSVVSAFYSNETSSVIAGLMNSMRRASHSVAVAAGPTEPLGTLGATGMVMTGDEVYIAQLAPTQVYILRDSNLSALPETAMGAPGDGTELDLDQDVDLFRARLEPRDVIVLASTDLRHELTAREIQGMLARRTAQEAAHDLCALAAQRGSDGCEVLVLRVGDDVGAVVQPIDSGELAGQQMAVAAASNGADRPGVGRRPSVAVNEPDWDAPPTGSREPPHRRGAAPSLGQQLASLPVRVLTLILVLPVIVVRAIANAVSGGGREVPPRPAPGVRSASPVEPPLPDDWSSLRQLREAGPAGMRATADPPAQPPATPPQFDYSVSPIGSGRDPFLYRRRRRSLPGPGSLLFAFALVLVVVMAVVLVLRNDGRGTPAADAPPPGPTLDVTGGVDTPVTPTAQGPARARELFLQAEATYREALDRDPSQGRAAILLLLRDAEDLANQVLAADVDRGLAPDINRLLSQIGREEDQLNRVRKLVPSATIGEFDSAGVGSAVESLDVRVDAKFVIDAVTGRVVEFATAKQGATVLRKGDVVGAVTVQDPIAVVNRALSVLVIDARYNIVSLQADQNPRLLRIAGTEEWRRPIAFDNFNNNLYVLDPEANVIFKYQATAGGYEVGSVSYLDPRDQIDLSEAIDFSIDGDIYVLFANGTVRQFRGGTPLAFEITGLEGETVRAAKVFTDVNTDSLYLVDPSDKRIVEIDKREGSEGAFIRQFKYAGSDDFFADIRDIWVSEIDGKLIVLGKDSIRQFVLPRVQESEQAPAS